MMSTRCTALRRKQINRLSRGSLGVLRPTAFRLQACGWVLLGALIPAFGIAAEPPQTASEFFAGTNLVTFRIVLENRASQQLEERAKTYVSGRVDVGDQVFEDVGIRLKGSGTFQPLYDHPSLAVKFNWHNPRQRFAGLTKLFLENSGQDATRMCKALANGAYSDGGLAAPRITQARVFVNGRDLGSYVVSEAMNKKFLKDHFGNGAGNLYEADFRDLNQMLKQANGPPGDQADLHALCRAAALTNRTERLQALARVLEIDQFLDYLAIEIILGNWDGYAFHQNNYRIYHNPGSNRMTFLPHDLDNTFFESGMCIVPPRKGLLTAALLDSESARQEFRQRIARLAPKVLDPQHIKQRIQASIARLSEGANTEEADAVHHRGALLEQCARHRLQNIEDQLADRRPPTPRFDSFNVARLSGWIARPDWNDADVLMQMEEETPCLSIKAQGGYCFGSWRLPVWLPAGRYRVEGAVRASGVAGLPSQTGSGVGVRVIGGRRGGGIQGDCTPWTPVRHEFVVQPDCEWVELIAELRAFTGTAWFDPQTLRLVRIK